MTAVPLAANPHANATAAAGLAALSDEQLLRRFTQTRDAAAFEVLVRRHGPVVQGVCRRLLGPGPDLDDAFQATFLVLARQAGTIRKRASLGSWLYGVARRSAANLRYRRARRHAREHGLNTAGEGMESNTGHADPVSRASLRELGAILEEEIERLPDRYREALLACHFEGLSTEAAAQRVGCATSTLKGRLVKARGLLRQGLERRGVTLSATALAVLCSEQACRAALPSRLVSAAVQAGIAFAADANGPSRDRAAAVAEQVLRGGLGLRGKLLLAALVVGLAVGGVGLAGHGWLGRSPEPVPVAVALQDTPGQGTKVPAGHVDLHGDPLPEGALARLGTRRFRQGGLMALSPDGRTVVACGDQAIQFWDAATGKLLRSVEGGGRVACYSPDGRLVAAADVVFDPNNPREQIGQLHVWDAATGKRLARLELPINMQPSLGFSPDSTLLAVGGAWLNGQSQCNTFLGLWRWDGTALKPLWEARPDKAPSPSDARSTALAFSADGKRLASGSFLNHTIRLWDVPTGKEVRRLKAAGAQVRALAFAPAGAALASASEDGTVTLWDTAAGSKLWDSKQTGDVGALAFAPNGKTLAAGGGLFSLPAKTPALSQPFLVLLDPANGKETHRLAVDQARQYVRAVAFSRDGKVLAAGCGSRLHFWDGLTFQERPGPAGHDDLVMAVAVAEDGRTAATAGTDGLVILWDLATAKEKLRLHGHRDAVVGVRFVPGGKLLAAAGSEHDPTVRLWDLATGKEVRALQVPPHDFLFTLAASPDGKLLAAGDLVNGSIHVWDLATGKLLHTLRNGELSKPGLDREKAAPGVYCLAFSPNGTTLAAGEHSGRGGVYGVVLWDARTGKKLRQFPVDEEGVHSLAFAPDGTMLATTGMASNMLDFWEVDTGTRLFGLPCGRMGVVAYSADGKTVAWGSRQEGVGVWEIASKKVRVKFAGRTFNPQTLAYSPDGRMLLSAGDKTVLVWDVTGLGREAGAAAGLSAERLHELWKALASPDAVQAGRAVWALTADAQKAIPFVAERLRELPGADPKRIRQCIAELDSKDFKVRDAAARQLESFGKLAEPALREALARPVALDVGQRLRKLLQKSAAASPSPELVQALRALEVLEHSGGAAARQALEQFAGQTADDFYRQEARAAALRVTK
jgi:RNA polymerase sigma factor (sigma-70 family)